MRGRDQVAIRVALYAALSVYAFFFWTGVLRLTSLWPDYRLIPWAPAIVTVVAAGLAAGAFRRWLTQFFTPRAAETEVDWFRRGRTLILLSLPPMFFGIVGISTLYERPGSPILGTIVLAALIVIGTGIYSLHRLKSLSRNISPIDRGV